MYGLVSGLSSCLPGLRAGASKVTKLRPVDVLNQILQEDRPGKLDQFFGCYGPAEASAMCYFVASSTTAEASSVSCKQAPNQMVIIHLSSPPCPIPVCSLSGMMFASCPVQRSAPLQDISRLLQLWAGL